MKLNIVDPKGRSIAEAFGVTHERRSEIYKELDRLCDIKVSLPEEEVNPISVLIELGEFCNNYEELLICISDLIPSLEKAIKKNMIGELDKIFEKHKEQK